MNDFAKLCAEQYDEAVLNDRVYTRDEVVAILREFGKALNIPTIYLFGSYARGDATPESDVDIVFDGANIHGLLELERARIILTRMLGKKVDMITMRSIEEEKDMADRRFFMESYLRDRVRIDV